MSKNDECTEDEWNELHYVRIHNLIEHIGILLSNSGRLVEIATRQGEDTDARLDKLKFLTHELDVIIQQSVLNQLSIMAVITLRDA